MERLDKFLCDCGVGTRSQVKLILKNGRVTVDGVPERDGGRKIDPDARKITLDGETFDVYLSVNYHELRWEWAAERLARELVSQSGANVVDQTFEKLTNGDPIYATELDVDGADFCVYFYRYRGSPTIVLRSGTTVVRANLDVLGEERMMDVQEIAEIIFIHIS